MIDLTADPNATLILSLAIIVTVAKLGGHLAARLGQPPVLGELLAGVVLGNLTLGGFSGLEYLTTDPAGALPLSQEKTA